MAQTDPSGTLADKLNRLFLTVRPAGRGPYSNEEVASAIRDRGGPSISATYIWLLRKGERDNPTLKHLEALAGFFGVPPAYFFDDDATARIDAELGMLSAIRDAGVRSLALRMTGLSSKSLQSLGDVVERVRELEGLEADGPAGTASGDSR